MDILSGIYCLFQDCASTEIYTYRHTVTRHYALPIAWSKSQDEYVEKALEVQDLWRSDALVTTSFAPHAPYTVNDVGLERVRMLADQLDIPVHIHVHETAQEVSDAENGRAHV